MIYEPEMCGSLEPYLQSEKRKFDPQRGWIYTYKYKGLSKIQVEALQQSWVQSGCTCEIELGRGMATLDVEDCTQQYTVDTWEIVANGILIDGFSHPTSLAKTVPNQISAMRRHLESNDTPDTAFADTILAPLLSDGTMPRFYSLQQRGSNEYRRSQYVLRHRTNAPSRWSANIADVGIDQNYTTAQLLTEVQDSTLWVVPLPARLVYKISNIPIQGPQSNYQWGWLKDGSTETTSANNRVDITTEYTLELWTTDYYATR